MVVFCDQMGVPVLYHNWKKTIPWFFNGQQGKNLDQVLNFSLYNRVQQYCLYEMDVNQIYYHVKSNIEVTWKAMPT